MGKHDRKTSTTMMAPHPADGALFPLDELARDNGMKPYELAGLCRAMGWAAGKQVTAAEFNQAAEAFKSRPMGGGRL